MIKALIFDLDGTLLATDNDLCTAINRVRFYFNCNPLENSVIQSYLGDGIRMLVTRSLPVEFHDQLDRAVELFHEYYSICYNDTTVPYPNVIETLRILQKYYRLSVVSNKAQRYVEKLMESHFSEFQFDHIYGDAINHLRKPEIQGITESLEAMNVQANETILIGDSTVDVQTALNSGIHMCPVAWGFQPKEVLHNASGIEPIEKFEDLILFIDRLNYN